MCDVRPFLEVRRRLLCWVHKLQAAHKSSPGDEMVRSLHRFRLGPPREQELEVIHELIRSGQYDHSGVMEYIAKVTKLYTM